DRVVAGVALGADEPRRGVNPQPLGGQKVAYARVVGHLCEGARIWSATSAPARPAVVRRLVRVVQADGAVSEDEHERREAIANTDIVEDAAHDVRHLPYRESRMRPDGRRFVLAIQLQAGSRGDDRRL